MSGFSSRHRQAGITALGFLFLAILVGVVGLAAIKIVPMYLKNMTMAKVLEDVRRELDGQGGTPASIRKALDARFAIESFSVPSESIKITQGRNGYNLRIQYENRAPYVADVYLLVAFDKQVEIRR